MAMNLSLYPSQNIILTEHGAFFYHRTWVTPSDDSWRLNFAGFTPNLDINAGFGCVLRDQNAIFKAGYAAPIRNSGDGTETELIALYIGLDIAQRQGVDYLEIEGDYSFVMQILTGVVDPMSFSLPSSVRKLLGECRKLIGKFRSVKAHEVHFHANEPAKQLAVMGSQLDEAVQWLDNIPSPIADSIILDVIGRWMPLDGP